MLSVEKQMLRAQVAARLREIPPAQRAAASARLRAALHNLPQWIQARTVFAFHPLPSEPDWIGPDWPADKILAFPDIDRDHLDFRAAQGPNDFVPGPHRIARPCGPLVMTPPDLILVPALAFDPNGSRLGRGRGFYDRWLAANPGAPSLGIAFAVQILPHLPVEAHDRPVHHILTERGLVADLANGRDGSR